MVGIRAIIGGAGIRSIQYGRVSIVAATSATDTITSVDTSHAFLILLGAMAPTNFNNNLPTVELTNATTVTARTGTAGTTDVDFIVVEFYPGTLKSVQQGAIDISGSSSAVAAISSVDTSKTILIPNGFVTTISGSCDKLEIRLELASDIEVEARRSNSQADTATVRFTAVEFN